MWRIPKIVFNRAIFSLLLIPGGLLGGFLVHAQFVANEYEVQVAHVFPGSVTGDGFENVETVTRSIIEMMSRQVWEAADSTHDRIVDEVVRHLRQSDEYVTSLLMLPDSKDLVPEPYKHLVKERYGLASDTTMWEYELSSVIEELDYIDSEINSSTAKMKYSPMEMSQMQSDYSAMQETASWIESQISAE